MKERFQKENRMVSLLALPVLLYTLYLLFEIITAALQGGAYPSEYREAANIQMTQAIINGVNPYSEATLNSAVPGVLYLYGPLMSVIAATLSFLTHADLVLIHYAISFLAMVFSALLTAKMVWEHTKTLTAPVTAFLFILMCHWRYGYVYGAPDSLGLFFLILILFVLTRQNMKKKAFICALLTILIFFTKQYYLMIAATAFIYFLFLSKKEAWHYAVWGIILTGITFALLQLTCPLFFTYAIYFVKGPGAGAAMGAKGIAHNTLQVTYLGGMFLCLFIVAAVDFIRVVILRHAVRLKWNIHHADEPLIMLSVQNEEEVLGKRNVVFDLLFWGQMLMAAVVLRYLGNNDGAFLSYYLQLFMPGLIVISVCALDNIKISKYAVQFLFVCYVIFLGYTIYKTAPRLIVNELSNEEQAEWQQAYGILDEHLDGEIYYIPPLAYHGFKNQRYVYNSGQPFVITEKYLKEYNKKKNAQLLFPDAGKIMQQHLNYREEVLEKVRRGEYSLITNLKDMDVVFTEDDLSLHYEKTATIPLRTGSWTWEIDFWILKAE